ncbi:MAG: DUF1641 domain-containing protein [Fuerstiella sp.]
MSTQIGDMAFREQLDDPQIAEALSRLLGRAGDVDRLVSQATEAKGAIDGLFATGMDIVDEQCENINASGTPVDKRLTSLITLLLKVTEPKTVDALGKLIDRLPQLEQASRLLEEVPGLVAIAVDVFDEFAKHMHAEGVDLEKSLTQGLHAALWLGCRVSNVELERLGYLLRSDVLDPHALEVVGNAASSLASCQRETCDLETADRVGLFGILAALRDPGVQKTLGFAIRFAKCFGSRNAGSNSADQATPSSVSA